MIKEKDKEINGKFIPFPWLNNHNPKIFGGSF